MGPRDAGLCERQGTAPAPRRGADLHERIASRTSRRSVPSRRATSGVVRSRKCPTRRGRRGLESTHRPRAEVHAASGRGGAATVAVSHGARNDRGRSTHWSGRGHVVRHWPFAPFSTPTIHRRPRTREARRRESGAHDAVAAAAFQRGRAPKADLTPPRPGPRSRWRSRETVVRAATSTVARRRERAWDARAVGVPAVVRPAVPARGLARRGKAVPR